MKMKVTYKADAADRQEWVVDRANPAWDIAYATEQATDWGWLTFLERLDSQSAIAWRALLWALRKRDGRLRLDTVEVDWDDIDLAIQCPRCEEWGLSAAHECSLPEPEPEPEAEAADEPEPEPEPRKGKKKAGESGEA